MHTYYRITSTQFARIFTFLQVKTYNDNLRFNI